MYQYFTQVRVMPVVIAFILAQIIGSAMAIGIIEVFPSLSAYPDLGFEILRTIPNILVILWFLYDMRKHRVDVRKDISTFRSQIAFQDLLALFVFNIAIGLFSVYAILYGAIALFPEQIMAGLSESNGLAKTTTLWGTLFGSISAVFCAPIAEEFIFRGFLFTKLRMRFSMGVAIVCSSLLFSAIHFSLSFVTTFLFAIILCIVFYKTKNIVIPIVLHMLNNSLVSIFSLWGAVWGGKEISDTLNISQISFQFYAIGLPCFFIAIVVAYFLIQKRKFLQLGTPFLKEKSL